MARLELESPICSGSATITNNHDGETLAIENQEVNTFDGYTTTGSTWDTPAN